MKHKIIDKFFRQIQYIRNVQSLLLLITILVSLYVYTRYFLNIDFGDEYDNFAYSWLTRKGVLPYRDFFTHHFPSLIFFGVPLEFIGHSKIIYRLFVLAVTFSTFIFLVFYLKGVYRIAALIFMLLASFAISFYGGFQYADGSFWALIIVTIFLIVIGNHGKPLGLWLSMLLGALIVFLFFSSPVHITPILLLFIYYLYLQKQKYDHIMFLHLKKDLKVILVTMFIIFAVFITYLTITKSLPDFYFSTIKYNNDHFYYRDNKQVISPKIADFYLHALNHFKVHLFGLAEKEGSYLLSFAKSTKQLLFIGVVNNYAGYTRVIIKEFYTNFFTFEVLIFLFYLTGLIATFINGDKSLVLFSILLIPLVRLRVPERIHEAPYYLLSYWFISLSIAFSLTNIVKRQKIISSLFVLFISLALIMIFVQKNWYDFNQMAFNRFSNDNEKTVRYLRSNSEKNEKIMVFANESASLYWESQRLPYGYFVNYFPWYSWSRELEDRLLRDVENYKGDFLILTNKSWENFNDGKPQDAWLNAVLKEVDRDYVSYIKVGENLIFQYKDKLDAY